MTIYNCEKCNFITENNYNYQKHINTKKHQKKTGEIENDKTNQKPIVIQPQDNRDTTEIVLYECDYCDASFKHTQSKYKHQKYRCKAKQSMDGKDLLLQEKDKQIEEHSKRVEHLEKMLNDALKQINNTTNNTTNNNKCTTNNIISINGYGKEDITYLTNEEWLKLLKNPRDSIKKLFLETHFNSEHPENKNIRQTNKKSKFIEVHDGDNWKNLNKKKILTDIAEDKQGILDDKVAKNDEIYNSMSTRQRRSHDAFHDQVFEDEKSEFVEDLEGCLLDNM